jgi:hypothetical protein
LSLVDVLVYFEVDLALELSIILAAGLLEFDAHIVIALALDFAHKPHHSVLVGYFPCVDDYLLSRFELVRHK